jgi:DNA-directed RNA polymerase specialized sigma24 family protein
MKDYRNGWGETLDLGSGSPELSSDLEWVLQSGQSDQNLIAEALLHAYHAPVYRLCLVLENDPGHAHTLLIRSFARAVQQAYRYRPKTDIPIWFFTFLLQELSTSTRRERLADLPVLLSALADFEPGQIADLLNRDAGRVKAKLSKLEKRPETILVRA